MKYRLRQVLATVLAVVLVASLSGCTAVSRRGPAPADKAPAVAAPAEPAGAGESPEDDRAEQEKAGKEAAGTKEQGGTVIIVSDNPVFTDSKQVMEEIVKELDDLLKILDSMEDLSGDDLNF